MTERHAHSIEELLPLYMEGKLTDSQRQEVEAWLYASPENRDVARNMVQAYQSLDNLYIATHTNTDEALQLVNRRLGRSRLQHFMRRMERVAAILFVPVMMGATALFYYAFHEKPVEMLSVATNPGMTATALLPDGTKVTLNSNSRLSYPAQFRDDERLVSLSGEAYFDVAKDKHHPFIVNTPYDAKVKVYGTHFNLEIDNEARQIVSTLEEGSVGLCYANRHHQWNERKIVPGQQIIYSIDNGETHVSQVEVDVATAWKDGKLIFRNTPLKAVLHSLSKRFDVKFIVRDDAIYRNSFTGTLERQRLGRILEILSMSSNMRFRYVPNADIDQQTQQIEIY